MDNKKDDIIRIVRGKDRYAGAPSTNLSLKVGLDEQDINYIDGERNVIVNVDERFDIERELSRKYRIVGKISNIFNNTLSGSTFYSPFKDDLYYTDPVESNQTGVWKGYPQYKEFAFLRTEGIPNHVTFNNKDLSYYNWSVYVSYASSNYDNQNMSFRYKDENIYYTNNFTISDGIPYYIKKLKINGKNLILFYCAFKHNLKVGEWVETNNIIAGKKYFEVHRLGDISYGNEDKVFAIYDYGYQDTQFDPFSNGTVKRVININNKSETTSKYYVRKHKILTTYDDVDITKMGFENINFEREQIVYRGSLTPNNIDRVATKNGTQTVGFSFDKDIDVSNHLDNNGRPITELFLTIINRGYMGYFNKPVANKTIRVGWDFNFDDESIDTWWSLNNGNNTDDIPYDSYQVNGRTFYHNDFLNIGDEIKGDICELNEYDQKETILSKMYHKYSFNSTFFNDGSRTDTPYGYAYIPHHTIPIKTYSDYIETGKQDSVDLVPDYAFYSVYDKQWRWRDLYFDGYVDTDGNGLDIPFFNGCHYPYLNINFLQTPVYRNNNVFSTTIIQPGTDECE